MLQILSGTLMNLHQMQLLWTNDYAQQLQDKCLALVGCQAECNMDVRD